MIQHASFYHGQDGSRLGSSKKLSFLTAENGFVSVFFALLIKTTEVVVFFVFLKLCAKVRWRK